MNRVFWWYGQGFDVRGTAADCRRLDPDGTLAEAVSPDQPIGIVIHPTNQVMEHGLVHNRSARNRFVIGAETPAGADRIRPMLPLLTVPGIQFMLEADLRQTMWHKLLHNLS